MRLVDWILLVVGLGGVVICLRGFAGADAVSITLLTIALALAVFVLALGLKSLLERMRSRGQTTGP